MPVTEAINLEAEKYVKEKTKEAKLASNNMAIVGMEGLKSSLLYNTVKYQKLSMMLTKRGDKFQSSSDNKKCQKISISLTKRVDKSQS